MSVTAHEIQALAQTEDDFPHELQIGKIMRSFQSTGLRHIQHGGAYNDPLTGKTRQFDFRALIPRDNSGASQEIQLAVEGKRINPAAPIIACGVERNEDEAIHDLIVSITSGCVGEPPRCEIEHRKSDFYQAGRFVGKSVFRAKKDKDKGALKKQGDGEIFEGYAQALSSSVELASRACRQRKRPFGTVVRSAILPVVVVPDGTLWAVKYDGDGNFDGIPEQTDTCEIFTANTIETGIPERSEIIEFMFSHVHILTLKGLTQLLTDLTTGDRWGALFGSQFPERDPKIIAPERFGL